MELFEEIRRDYAAGETIKKLAKKHGVRGPIDPYAFENPRPKGGVYLLFGQTPDSVSR